MLSGGDKPGDVRHVYHQHRAHLVGYLAKTREVYDPRVGCRACHDELGAMLFSETLHVIVVDKLKLAVYSVWHEVVYLGGEVDRAAVRQMTAVVEAHSHHGVARTERREVCRHVSLRAAVGLNIRVFGIE